MKKSVLFILILLNLAPAFAGSNDSLLHLFQKNYRAEKATNKKFIGAIFEATSHTISINNPLARRQLIQTGKTDTTAIKTVTAAIVSRFLDEHLMQEECSDDFIANKELFDFYSDFQCKCLTEKAEQNKGNSTATGASRYLPYVETCTGQFNRDTAMVAKMRSLVSDMGRIQQISKCTIPYLHIKCPMIRSDVLTTCYHMAMAEYNADKEEQNLRWRGSLVNYLLTKPAGDMRSYYASDAAYAKIRSDFYTPARRLGALNTKPEELYCTTELTNNQKIITFVYSGRKPEVICQLVYDYAWENFQFTIKSTKLIPAANIKNKTLYIIEATQKDAPPPMETLK